MENLIKTEQYKGYKICIVYDTDPSNPRTEFDNFGTMVTWHRRYSLGDEQPDISPEEFISEHINDVILPVYMYDHSGITISTTAFSCGWDSGFLGYIYVTRQGLQNAGLENKTKDEIEGYLKKEISIYDDYLKGLVYGYEVYFEGELQESCYGYYGYNHEESGLLPAAKAEVDRCVNRRYAAHFNQLKQWIRNKVPLIYRKPAL